MSYVFDTSALIGAWVRSYPPDLFPRVWEQMDSLAADGRLIVPAEVLDELGAQDDALLAWVKERATAIIVPTTRAVMLEARAVLADFPHLTKTGTGRGRADPFVIAEAALRGLPVVTQEQGGSTSKPRIPFVCQQRGIACHAILDVIRAEGWRF
jgi:hypothetical protein